MTTAPSLPSEFANQVVEALSPGGRWASIAQQVELLPTRDQFASLLDVSFFASTSQEEGRQARFSLAVRKPKPGGVHMLLAPRPLTVDSLAKLSAACHADATALLVCPAGRSESAPLHLGPVEGDWFIWGVGVNVAPLRRSAQVEVVEKSLVLTAREPGVLSLRLGPEILFSYARGSGFIPDAGTAALDLISEMLAAQTEHDLGLSHLSSICRTMRAHGRGGALLVVPKAAPATIHFTYEIAQNLMASSGGADVPQAPLADAMRVETSQRASFELATGRVEAQITPFLLHAIDNTDAEAALIGRLTAIDGIVAIDHQVAVLGFGGKIPVPDDFLATPVLHLDPRTGERSESLGKQMFTGMRHSSAAVACLSHGAGAMAFVQSQDGLLTVIVCQVAGQLVAIRPMERLIPFLER